MFGVGYILCNIMQPWPVVLVVLSTGHETSQNIGTLNPSTFYMDQSQQTETTPMPTKQFGRRLLTMAGLAHTSTRSMDGRESDCDQRHLIVHLLASG